MSESDNTIDYGVGKKQLNTYIFGVALCVLLTLIPFAVVMHRALPFNLIMVVIYGCALLQFLVQTLCFVRLNTQTEQSRLNLMLFVFFIVVLLVIVFGSLWIMSNLNYNMMH